MIVGYIILLIAAVAYLLFCDMDDDKRRDDPDA
jgi:hypothetical protein